MRIDYSEIQERAYGTYERNKLIMKLLKKGVSQAEIARKHKVSRQCINQIAKRKRGLK